MKHELSRDKIPVPDDDGNFPFEVWKEGGFLKGFSSLEEAQSVCAKGNYQSGGFEIRSEGKKIWP